MTAAVEILVIHGPNLNLLGEREPEVYGRTTLAEIDDRLEKAAKEAGVHLRSVQSNSEGTILDTIQGARKEVDGLLINPGAYTHYSYAIRDCIAACGIPTIEVHLSNIEEREAFRRKSVIRAVCRDCIMGLGPDSYLVALKRLLKLLRVT